MPILAGVNGFYRLYQQRPAFIFENDFIDVQQMYNPFLGRSKPTFSLEGGSLTRITFNLSLWGRLMDRSRLVWLVVSKLALLKSQFAPPPEQGIGLVVASLNEIRALGNRKGAQVNIFAHRRLERSSIDDSVWNEFLQRSGAVDLTDKIRREVGPDSMGRIGAPKVTAGSLR